MAKKSISPRKLVDRSVPSGLESCWKLWRFCLCRNGFYPLVVAPFVTAAWLLDLYGTMGCNSLHLDVGMEPLNTAWNKTSMDLGLFHFRSDEMNEMGQNHDFLMSALHPECHRYDALFNEYFIDGDKTWKMSQYMAYISGSAGCIATVSSIVIHIACECLDSPFLIALFSFEIGHDLDDDHHSITIMLFLAWNITAIFPCDAPCWWGKVSFL